MASSVSTSLGSGSIGAGGGGRGSHRRRWRVGDGVWVPAPALETQRVSTAPLSVSMDVSGSGYLAGVLQWLSPDGLAAEIASVAGVVAVPTKPLCQRGQPLSSTSPPLSLGSRPLLFGRPISTALLLPRPEEERDVSDCASLRHLDEANLLQNLCVRFSRGQIYTYVAHVLLAVNPYKTLPSLYGEAAMAAYVYPEGAEHVGRPAPHVYAISRLALRGLRRGAAQAILISGESGAGKTESAKVVMRFLENAIGGGGGSAESGVLAMSRVLESFGHACTSRNANSSRFGKYLRLRLDGQFLRAQATTYLLEVGRLTRAAQGDHSFRVFYELLAGLPADELARLRLRPGLSVAYSLLGGHATTARDRAAFTSLTEAFTSLRIESHCVHSFYEAVAALLHLGDVVRDEPQRKDQPDDDDAAAPVQFSEGHLIDAADLLGFRLEELRSSLLVRKIGMPGMKFLCEAPRSKAQTGRVLRSLMVTIYVRLFDAIVAFLNSSLNGDVTQGGSSAAVGAKSSAELGVLDIYGFETLERNSLEQLLINLANERLQRFFVERVLVAEQAEYFQEGLISKQVALPDASVATRAILSILDTLDDHGRLGGASSDARFCDAALRSASLVAPGGCHVFGVMAKASPSSSRSYPASRRIPIAFCVAHYAGRVHYVRDGWLEMNDARPLSEVEALLAASSKTFVRCHLATGVVERNVALDREMDRSQFRSVSRRYRRDLDALLTMLGASQLNFIRCFRPNSLQTPDHVDRGFLLEQLRGCGTPQLLQVMHQGFPHRIPLADVVSRLGPLVPEAFRRRTPRSFVQILMLAYGVPRSEWALGVTKLFLKDGRLHVLEELNAGAAPSCQAFMAAAFILHRQRWRAAFAAISFARWLPAYAARRRWLRQRARHRLRSIFWSALVVVRLRRLSAVVAARGAAEDEEIAIRPVPLRKRPRPPATPSSRSLTTVSFCLPLEQLVKRRRL